MNLLSTLLEPYRLHFENTRIEVASVVNLIETQAFVTRRGVLPANIALATRSSCGTESREAIRSVPGCLAIAQADADDNEVAFSMTHCIVEDSRACDRSHPRANLYQCLPRVVSLTVEPEIAAAFAHVFGCRFNSAEIYDIGCDSDDGIGNISSAVRALDIDGWGLNASMTEAVHILLLRM